MSLAAKFTSALGLLARGDFASVQRQTKRNFRLVRLRRATTVPFLFRDLGFPAVCHPDWPDSTAIFLDGHSDTWEFDLLRTWLEPGDHVVDAGANLGLYSFAAASVVGPHGIVLAIEAAPYLAQKLVAAAQLLGAQQLRVAPVALTDRSGEITFHIRSNGVSTTDQSLRPAPAQLADSTAVTVPTQSFSGLQREHGLDQIAAVKIDIEGAELLALRGTPREWFSAEGPLWITEINPAALARFDAKPQDITAHFPPDQFERWLLAKHPLEIHAPNRLVPLADDESFTDSHYYNLFALPRGRRWESRRSRLARFFGEPVSSRVA